jgi:hypothetical protein
MTVPIRAVNLSAASTDIADVLEAIRHDIENNSTWSVVHDYGAGLNNTANNLTFTSGTPDTITSSGDDWNALGIGPGDQIDIDGSTSNDGRHTVAAISGGSNEVIELTTSLALTAEGPSSGITVSRVGDTTLGNGRYSMAIRSPGGGQEINFRCDGTIALPSTALLRVGINPDGGPGANEITDSRSPHTSSANFSGTDGGKQLDLTGIGNTEFIWMEWPDAVMALFKNAARTLTPRGIHAGKTLLNPLTSLANPGGGSKVRMDGHAIFGSRPGGSNTSTYDQWYPYNFAHRFRRRLALGQTHSATGSRTPSVAWTEEERNLGDYLTADIQVGALLERVPLALHYTRGTANRGPDYWYAKYLRVVPYILPPYSVWESLGVDRYMVLGSWQVTPDARYTACGVFIPDGFNPNP